MALRQWLTKPPAERAAAARQLGEQLRAPGSIRDDVAAAAPSDVTDAMDKFLAALADWRA